MLTVSNVIKAETEQTLVPDNITVVLARLGGNGLASADEVQGAGKRERSGLSPIAADASLVDAVPFGQGHATRKGIVFSSSSIYGRSARAEPRHTTLTRPSSGSITMV
jgi:hypothetical protein